MRLSKISARLIALIGLFVFPAAARAQYICNEFATPSEIRENRTSARGTQTFCDGNIFGSEDCGGVTGKVEFFLTLESGTEIDLDCYTDNGFICLMDETCSELIAGDTGSRVRVSGPFETTDLKIVVSDDDAGTLCDQGLDPTVTCVGSFGGRVILDTDFEADFESQGWSVGSCPGCILLSGTIGASQSVLSDPTGHLVSGDGPYVGVLEVSSGLGADLHLWRRSGGGWERVASARSADAAQEIVWRGGAGLYRWEVEGVAGRGQYALWFGHPRTAEGPEERDEE